jgi:hypothetical protein
MGGISHLPRSFRTQVEYTSSRRFLRNSIFLIFIAGILVTLAIGWSRPSAAHFYLDTRIRVIHVEHLTDGLRIYIRLPLPLVLAGLVGPEDKLSGARNPAPYTQDQVENGQTMHYLDIAALRRDPLGLGQLVADGHGLFLADRRLPWIVEATRVYPAAEQPRFTTLDEVRTALQGPPFASAIDRIYIGNAVVDVKLRLYYDQQITHYWFASRLAPDLKGLEDLANLLIDYGPATPAIYRALGTLRTPIEVNLVLAQANRTAQQTDWYAAFRSFVTQGMTHVFEGLDHVLFILCLTVGAGRLSTLLWRATGFTLGHSVSLSLGVFGITPSGEWFVPTIEATIAASIIYAGVVAILRRELAATLLITALIGLLHGFGFSFVLRTLLQVDTPHLWPSLIGFNVGVEIAQVAIIVSVWMLLATIDTRLSRYSYAGRALGAVTCIAIASFWTVQRLAVVWQQIS